VSRALKSSVTLRPRAALKSGWMAFALASPEFAPASRIVMEPFAQPGARRQVLQPAFERQALLLHPARPKPIHQESRPITLRGRFVNALDLNHAKKLSTSFDNFPYESFPNSKNYSSSSWTVIAQAG